MAQFIEQISCKCEINSTLKASRLYYSIKRYCHFLLSPVTDDLLEKLGFVRTKDHRGYPTWANCKYEIVYDQYGFYLGAYDSVDGTRLSRIEQLCGLDIEFDIDILK